MVLQVLLGLRNTREGEAYIRASDCRRYNVLNDVKLIG